MQLNDGQKGKHCKLNDLDWRGLLLKQEDNYTHDDRQCDKHGCAVVRLGHISCLVHPRQQNYSDVSGHLLHCHCDTDAECVVRGPGLRDC